VPFVVRDQQRSNPPVTIATEGLWHDLTVGGPTQAPIGLFDSGVGGLTVVREMYRQLPNESIIYVGDTARLPYGTRTGAEILQFVREILNFMVSQGTKMVIMACNTSSALALEQVRSEYAIPILGVILPGAFSAAQQGDRIGVIATPATANSHAYRDAIARAKPTAQVWEVGCPEFVPIIEQNLVHAPETREVVQRYLAPLMEWSIDTLIYGCTHYPHLAPVIRSILPDTVQLIDPAVAVVQSATQELERLHLRHGQPALPSQFYVSGDPEPFTRTAKDWLGYTPIVQVCDLAVFAVATAAPATLESIESA
jgi:glutamate racemase